uniref:Uncharacterized protein n=1 Tax=Arundo donax TaxID=35708 RepID=A0A0A9A351_ARUDO
MNSTRVLQKHSSSRAASLFMFMHDWHVGLHFVTGTSM